MLLITSAVLACVTESKADTGPVDTIKLNGRWDFAYVAEGQGKPPSDARFKTAITVPGCWDDALNRMKAKSLWPDARFNPDYQELQLPVTRGFANSPDASLPYLLGSGWYRRCLDVPSEWRERQIVLRVGRVVMEADVFVNGKLVHHHLGHSMPWEAVLSPHFEYGKQNELLIRVDNRRNDRLGCSIRGWKGRSGGIFGPVSLRLAGRARIADWHVYPSDEQLHWRAHIEGDVPVDAELRWTVYDPRGGKKYGSGTLPLSGKQLSWTTAKLGIPAWSDTDPRLVEIRLELAHKTGRMDEVRRPFGLRLLTRHGVDLRLNGKHIFLRGICECAYFPETCTPPMDVEWYRQHIRCLKDLGFNWLRGHTWPLNEPYLQAADELGMLVQVEPPRGYQMGEWQHIVRASRKHPSVVIYCCGNEETLDDPKIAFLRLCAEEQRRLAPDALFMPQEAMRGVEYHFKGVPAKELVEKPFRHNPGRLKTLREFSDVFGQYAWGWFSYTTLRGTPEDVDRCLEVYGLPCLAHELGIIGGYLDLLLEDRYRGTRIGPELFGKIRASLEDADLLQRAERYHKNSAAWHALIAKQVCEKARRSPYIAGYDMLGACDVHWHRSGYGCGLMNEFDQIKSDVTAADIRGFNGQNILMIGRHQQRNLFAGSQLKREVFVSWFGGAALPAARLDWSLTIPNGKTLGRGRIETRPVLQGKSERIGTIELALPAAVTAVKATLRVTLSAPGVELANRWDYWIFPRATPKDHDNLLVVNDLDAKALQQLSRGGRVVLLGHKPFAAARMSFQIGISGRPEGNLATLIENHPITDRFPHDDFCDWQFAPMLEGAVPVQFNDLDVRFDPIIEVASSYKRIRKQALLFEWRVGKGRLLVCGLNLGDADPAGAYFRRILLEYATGDGFKPQTRIGLKTLAKMAKLKIPTPQEQPETDKALDPSGQLPSKKK